MANQLKTNENIKKQPDQTKSGTQVIDNSDAKAITNFGIFQLPNINSQPGMRSALANDNVG